MLHLWTPKTGRVPRTTNETKRLRAPKLSHPFHIVLVEPEIPPNTGNIARLAAATACPLHLVGKLGFRIDEQAVRRAGVDYWHLVDVRQHDSLESFCSSFREISPSGNIHLFTGVATRTYTKVRFTPGDALVFGKESTGLSQEHMDIFPDNWVGIPTLGAVRSLNLANAVSIGLFEALRQSGTLDQAAIA